MDSIINKQHFHRQVIEEAGLNIVQFKAEWSGACQIMAGVYNTLADSFSEKAGFFTVDIDDAKELQQQWGVTELPTILFFYAGQVVDHIIGMAPKQLVINAIENNVRLTVNNYQH
jgi:thioredoxin 1